LKHHHTFYEDMHKNDFYIYVTDDLKIHSLPLICIRH